jgi:pilus assembly protein CpaB
VNRRVVLLIASLLVAAVGTALVFVYVNSANNRALADQHPVKVLVAKLEIPGGTPVSAIVSQGLLEQKDIPASAVVTGALADTTPINDQSTVTNIYPGQQIIPSLFAAGATGSAPAPAGITLPKGMLAISVQLGDVNRVGGFVQPGSHVAIFMNGQISPSAQSANATGTRLLVPDVEIVAVGQTTVTPAPVGQANPEAIPRALMTLAVTQSDAEKIIFAQTKGQLFFGLLNGQSRTTRDGGITSNNLFN